MVDNITYEAKETHNCILSEDSEENTVINQYTLLNVLGEGSYSEVFLAEDKNTKEKYAMKIINKRILEKKVKSFSKDEEGNLVVNNLLTDALKEIALLRRINHDNIISLKEIIYDNENCKIYLVLQYASQGQILIFNEDDMTFDINRTYYKDREDKYYSEDTIRDFMRDLVSGIDYRKYLII